MSEAIHVDKQRRGEVKIVEVAPIARRSDNVELKRRAMYMKTH